MYWSDSKAFYGQCVTLVNTCRWFPYAHPSIRSLYICSSLESDFFPLFSPSHEANWSFMTSGEKNKEAKLALIGITLADRWAHPRFFLVSCYFYRLVFNFHSSIQQISAHADSTNTEHKGEICPQRGDGVCSRNSHHLTEIITDTNVHHLLLFLITLNSSRKIQASPWFAVTHRQTKENRNNKPWWTSRSLWWSTQNTQMDLITAYTPTYTLRSVLVIKQKLARPCTDSTEQICVGDLASHLRSAQSKH